MVPCDWSDSSEYRLARDWRQKRKILLLKWQMSWRGPAERELGDDANIEIKSMQRDFLLIREELY